MMRPCPGGLASRGACELPDGVGVGRSDGVMSTSRGIPVGIRLRMESTPGGGVQGQRARQRHRLEQGPPNQLVAKCDDAITLDQEAGRLREIEAGDVTARQLEPQPAFDARADDGRSFEGCLS